MNYYKHHIGDYAKKTGHLSVLEHGAYLLMLHAYYGTEKPLPIGEQLYRITRAQTKAERAAVDSIASQFWKKTDTGLVNGRAFDEIVDATKQGDASRQNGNLGGRPKKTYQVSETKPKHNLIQTPDSNNQTPYVRSKNPSAHRTAPTPPIEFEDFKLLYPDRAGDQGWRKALRAANARIEEGCSWTEILEGTRRYAAYARSTGNWGTEFVKQAATFLGPELFFKLAWDLPKTKADTLRDSNISASQQWLRDQETADASH